MAVYKDNATGTWRVIYRFTNWKGERKQTQKRGFATKREAQAWEHEAMLKQGAKLDMTFASFFEVYEADKKQRVKESTWESKSHTQVGELGDTLSGGERQRIGLARAFLHNAPFMLLDEPTSNLDSLNEAVILKALNDGREDKTIVLVSHRESTMRIADKVYSVENGRMS